MLAWAAEADPADGLACHLLACLCLSRERQGEACRWWERAVERDPGLVIAWRNLGWLYRAAGELERARAAYEQALELDPRQARLCLLERDALYAELGLTVAERLAALERQRELALSHGMIARRLVALLVRAGRYPEALELLSGYHFHSWEGRYDVHQYWVESRLRQGARELEAGRVKQALEHFRLSLTYPENLEVAEYPGTVCSRQRYWLGRALEAAGRMEEARAEYQRAQAGESCPSDASWHFRARALERLGRSAEAQAVYHRMLESLEREGVPPEEYLVDGVDMDPGRNLEAIACYRRSLALEGLGREEEALRWRQEALRLDPLAEQRAFSPPRAGWGE